MAIKRKHGFLKFRNKKNPRSPLFSVILSKISIHTRLLLWSGVRRRFLLYIFKKKYIAENVSKRQGECLQCGACCKLVLKKCQHLTFDSNGKALCLKYKNRLPNCKIFPVDIRDINERNIVSDSPCGFSFGQPVSSHKPIADNKNT